MISHALPKPGYRVSDPSGLGYMDLGRSSDLFWRNLSVELAEREISMAQLARDLKITQSAISKWKAGNPPTLDSVDAVAAHLKVTVAYLLRDPEAEPRAELDVRDVYRFLGAKLGIKPEQEK